jgi:spore germination protein GerM
MTDRPVVCRRRRLAALLLLTVAAAGCGLGTDDAPRDIAADERAATPITDPDAGEATGTARIYLVTSDDTEARRQLRSVARDVPDSARNVLVALLAGPNQDEVSQRLRSAIPGETQLLSTTAVGGILTVDLDESIQQLSGDGLTTAIAQIVFTASELDGVRAVRIRVAGETTAWPRADGVFVDVPLTVYDYPGLVESTQPAYPSVPSPA